NPPQTGDSSSLTPAMAVFVAAGAALAAVAAHGRKRSQRQ
ncbi:MAG TPA: LPXTG cell wall anchor domain-containing protein, partial [Candidatus Enterenecus avicola]|nr:LPXTG cell wall anchor domain-containing protein [Candidatus Enterenecus avicola]